MATIRMAGPPGAEKPSPAHDSPAHDPPPHDEVYARRLLITVILGVTAFSSSMTIVSAVLSVIAEGLHSTPSTISWGVTGLFLTMAIGTPVMGRVGDAIGRRRVFLIGTATLTAGTVACALAWNAASFIGFRMLVGFGIACTMPNGMAMVIEAYPPAKRAIAMGWFQMVMSGAPVFALILGAWMTDAFGWRSVFILLSPVSALGFVSGWRTIKDTGPEREGVRIDWTGAACLGLGTLGFLLGLQRIKSTGISDTLALAMFVLSIASIGAFVAVEKRVSQPLLRLDYFRRRNFSGPLIAQSLTQFAYMGGFVITPLLLKSTFGLGIGASSWVLLFRPTVFSIASPFAGRLSTRWGPRPLILAGGVLMVASMAVFATGAAHEALWLVIVGLVLSGLASGAASPSYATAVAATVDSADLGVANGMSSTLMNIGTLSGIQTMFVILGDSRSDSMFARVFWVGAIAAAVSLIGPLIMQGRSTEQLVASPAAA